MKLTLNNIEDVFKSKKSSIETLELKGYKLIKEFFVDSSGFGQDFEPALTIDKFLIELRRVLEEAGMVYSFITGVGPFQVYVGLFSKTGKKNSKIVANNTLKIETEEGYIIRLYDTNIIEVKKDKIILNTGGFYTHTTKSRINEFLPAGYVFQKDWNWFYQPEDKREKPILFGDDHMLTITN